MKDIENMIENLVERVLSEEVNKKVKDITESVSTEIDEMEEYYEVAKNRKEERKATKKDEPKVQTKAEPGSEKMVANPTQLKSLLPKGIADKKVKNPETGKMIKVKSALKYDKDSPVYKATVAMVKQAIKK